MKNKIYLTLTAIAVWMNCTVSSAQNFTQVTSTSNPIVTDPVETFYNGASWVDYDNDGLQDLFVVRTGLYHNDGNGMFSKITTSGLPASGIGNTWADVDNDGDIDCFISGGFAGGSKLYLNNGNGTFTKNTNGPFAVDTLLRGWGSTFGDYNNDGLVDVFIAAPLGFAAITDSCKFLVNIGNGDFVRVDTAGITDTLDAFTVPSWSDYDNDGDIDLFIGSGRVNGSLSRDYLFDNNYAQGGNSFTRINTTPLGTDLHDGQIWNWIDFDNDGDLDAYLTNYTGSTPATGYQNEMYRNDNGAFIKLTGVDVGPIVTDLGISLSSTWGDFDNDGDLDCIVTNEGQQHNAYYQSNIRQGSAVFTKITNEPFVINNGDHYCATSADYDNDGDLDLFISGNSDKGLFESNASVQTNFINIKLTGVTSNKSGIGAKVRVYANGYWQMRELSAQNTFNGMNMLNAHFGFGSTGPLAFIIDTIKIEWPSGTVDLCTNVYANTFYSATEGQCPVPVATAEIENSGTDLMLLSAYPNPVDNKLFLRYFLSHAKKIEVTLIDTSGKTAQQKLLVHGAAGNNNLSIAVNKLSKGIYTVVLNDGKQTCKGKFVKR